MTFVRASKTPVVTEEAAAKVEEPEAKEAEGNDIDMSWEDVKRFDERDDGVE